MRTNIWNPASKILDFDLISKNLQLEGIRNEVIYGDYLRKINCTSPSLIGVITIVEYYSLDKGFYFLYWSKDEYPSLFENCIFKINAKTGVTVSEGDGFDVFKKHVSFDDSFLEMGFCKEGLDAIKKSALDSFSEIITTIDYEVKQTIRTNAEDFVLNLCSQV